MPHPGNALLAWLQDKTGYSSGEEGSYVGPAATSTSNGAGVYSTPAGSSPLAASSAAAAAAAHSAEGEEVRLVDSICTPGGLRAQPDKADLKTFVESLGNNLDGELLVALLTSKMVHASCTLHYKCWTTLDCEC